MSAPAPRNEQDTVHRVRWTDGGVQDGRDRNRSTGRGDNPRGVTNTSPRGRNPRTATVPIRRNSRARARSEQRRQQREEMNNLRRNVHPPTDVLPPNHHSRRTWRASLENTFWRTERRAIVRGVGLVKFLLTPLLVGSSFLILYYILRFPLLLWSGRLSLVWAEFRILKAKILELAISSCEHLLLPLKLPWEVLQAVELVFRIVLGVSIVLVQFKFVGWLNGILAS